MKPPKKVLSDITLNEVSFVDAGANPGAHLMFWKKAPAMHLTIAKLKDLFRTAFPAPAVAKAQIEALMKMDDAKTFGQTIMVADAWTTIWQSSDALNQTLRSILECDEPEKQPLLNAALDEFKQYVMNALSEAAIAAPAETDQEAVMAMSEDLKKSLGLAATATDADVAAAVTKALADLAKARHDAAFAALPADHKDYAVTKALAGDDLAAFIAKSDDDRAAMIKAEPVAKSAAEIELAKRDRELADLRKGMVDLQKSAQIATIAKRAEADMPLVAKADELADLIYEVGKSDAGLADRLEAVLKTANARIEKGGLFKEAGSGLQGVSKAADALEAAAKELQKANAGWSIQKARMEARKANRDLAEQERTESRQAA